MIQDVTILLFTALLWWHSRLKICRSCLSRIRWWASVCHVCGGERFCADDCVRRIWAFERQVGCRKSGWMVERRLNSGLLRNMTIPPCFANKPELYKRLLMMHRREHKGSDRGDP